MALMNDKGPRALQRGDCWKQGKQWPLLLLQMPSPSSTPITETVSCLNEKLISAWCSPLAFSTLNQALLSRALVVLCPQVLRAYPAIKNTSPPKKAFNTWPKLDESVCLQQWRTSAGYNNAILWRKINLKQNESILLQVCGSNATLFRQN